ncbi:AMP-binding protein [Streptomyces sparsogenes]|uniref:AMP-dependent synthetase and ligase n=1 Tax=Streptomyces sparsogenes DSM 40356 TaxID=1331668 RepID=A0A1R1SRP9_9ACTN|nr:AMP-binding protein [Streptomyces sparsogenes]OMI40892.1 AMP-dependent synthetase and ligase [Streptomyces sparsogenes DSM 40356]
MASGGGPDARHGLHGHFLNSARTHPDRPALRVGDRGWTYAEVHRTALSWASALVEAAGGRPTAVGVLAERGEVAYVGILAAMYAGAAAMPLNVEFPAARTDAMLRVARPAVVLADDRGAEILTELADHPPVVRAETLKTVGVNTREPAEGGESARGESTPGGNRPAENPGGAVPFEPWRVEPDDRAYIMFTSGSTGRPKGVPISHRNAEHFLRCVRELYDFGPRDVFSQTVDITFDPLIFDLFAAWSAGACVARVPGFGYADLPALVNELGITVWFSAPSAISVVRRTRRLTDGAMPGLRWSFFAGEALMEHDAADWQRAAPGSTVVNLYGPTEVTMNCTVHAWRATDVLPPEAHGAVPMGRLHPGMRAMLLDADGARHPERGELCVAGPQVFAGYLDPADDAGRFLDLGGERWYRTGDLVTTAPDGTLLYSGRLDHQVQIRGVRVEIPEVEWALRRCPGVDEAVVVAVAADNTHALHAFYTGTATERGPVVEALGTLLPRAAIPRVLKRVARFPLNAHGKTDRKALAEQAARETGQRDTRQRAAGQEETGQEETGQQETGQQETGQQQTGREAERHARR